MKQIQSWQAAGSPLLEIGEIVSAMLFNSLQNRSAVGKIRPAVLIHREGGHFLVAGLTTRSKFFNGMDRTPIPNPLSVGLSKPGFIWGSVSSVGVNDIYDHIGFIDYSLALQLRMALGLPSDIADELDNAALTHNSASRNIFG